MRVIRNVMALLPLSVLVACGVPEPEATADSALAAASEECRVGRGPLTVMSRNLYLGADLGEVVAAGSLPVFLAETTEVWNTVLGNDFHARAELLADEIARARPEAIGLQEAYLWRTQFPSDQTSLATQVEYDYVADLLTALHVRGQHYEVAESIDLFDFEAPTLLGLDARMTDRQVILVRQGVEFSNPRGSTYTYLLPVSVLGNTVEVKRGWTAVDLDLGGETVAFFNTHLESFYAPIRVAQGMELAAILDATPGKVVLVGDLNSLPGTEGAASVAGAGFTDVWAQLHPRRDGFTCCWPEELANTEPGLDQRIDYVFVRGLKPLDMRIIGARPWDHRTGLWPTDHAGLVADVKPLRGMWGHD
jgi:endonuclease/exonuclease/phosphatase family metal-dependent hydrolase